MKLKIRKILVMATCLSIGFSILNAESSSSAFKAGSACAKAGQTSVLSGKKFTCVKIGQKLQWDKGVADKSSKLLYPIALSGPITQAAYDNFVKTYKERRTHIAPNITWNVAPGTDPAFAAEIKSEIEAISDFWNPQRPRSTRMTIWVAMSTNFQWIYDNMMPVLADEPKNSGTLEMKLARSKAEGEGFMGGGDIGVLANGEASLFFNASPRAGFGDSFWTQVMGHEYTHSMQRYILNGNMGPMLCWVREGQANYYGWSLAGRDSQAAFRNFWLQAISRIPTFGNLPDYETKTPSFWADWFLKGEAFSAGECDPWLNYIAGAMAFQYLDGVYGQGAIDQFMTSLKDGWKGICPAPVDDTNHACVSWKISFKNAFGVTPEAAYKPMGQHIYDEIQWAKGKTVSWGVDALKIAPPPSS
jgi:hypothetical protein